jgi:uncharacterized protein (TIGR00661 family)
MRILFGVFDWGLGHATRDTPIIEELIRRKNEVDIISTGNSLSLLKNHFGGKCRYFDVDSIYAPYPKSRFFVTKFTFSIPKMLMDLKKARKDSEKIIKKGSYDWIISDCRYDVYDKRENSFLINHQLKFKSPIFESVTEKFLSIAMKKYGVIVVPDYENRELSGELSFNKKYDGRVEYIGILSRLKQRKLKQDIDFFISLSGIDPQRSILEKKILKQISKLKGSIVVTGGNPEIKSKSKKGDTKFFSFLDLKEQEEIMNRAKFIVSRSGYSTVMDLIELEKKKALFIPTPGQTEQEYLADMYEEKRYFHHISQQKLKLNKDINDSLSFKGYRGKWKTSESVNRFLKLISH